ncbi:hypothetical protein HUJ05_001797 [Dendroctonus ponderosae]|nr:hypothetical protein HUJ05_001797 [Dendroctonus ponderosae]
MEVPDYFRKRVRITTDQFDTLLRKVTPLIQKCDTNMREALLPKIKLEVLWLPAIITQLLQNHLEFQNDVLDAIFNVLQEHIAVPSTRDQWTKIQNDFFDRWQFPFCCGALDGKCVLIQNPRYGASDSFNYKNGYSVVFFAIVDVH